MGFVVLYDQTGRVRPPAAPTLLSATAINDARIDLAWTDNASNEDGFKIERSPDGVGSWVEITTVGADVVTYSNTGLDPSTQYFYRVRAYKGGANSAYSNVDDATTTAIPAPSGLSATAISTSRIDLAWTDNSATEDGFKIERSPAGAGTWAQIDTVGAGVVTYSNTGLTSNTGYDYRVRAYRGSFNSAYSGTATASTYALPSDVSGLQMWLSADSGTFQDSARTVPAVSDGDPVGGWADQSGNAKHGSQTTSANKPTLKLSIVNSKPVLRFDGTDFLVLPTLAALTAGEIFVVVKTTVDPASSSTTGGLWRFGTSNATQYSFSGDGVIYDDFGTTSRKTTVNPATTLAQFNVYNVISVSGEWTNILNGTQLFTTGTNTVAFNSAPWIGEGDGGGPTWLVGDISEIFLFDAKLSAGNRTLMLNYLRNKYNTP